MELRIIGLSVLLGALTHLLYRLVVPDPARPRPTGRTRR
jgi:hypothetical protein